MRCKLPKNWPRITFAPAHMAKITLRAAYREESALLSDICMRAKARWGYDAEFMQACRAELSVAPEDFPHVFVALWDARIIGVASLSFEQDETCLEKLFIEPDFWGKGVGQLLLDHACAYARKQGAGKLRIDSDPHAAAFYARYGAKQIGTVPSASIKGRVLPCFEYAL